MLYKNTNPTSIETGGVAEGLREKPEEEDCHSNNRDGDEGFLPSAEEQVACPFPAEEQVKHETGNGANQLEINQRTDDQTNGSSQKALPDFPDSLPGALKDDAQHKTDEDRYESHEHVIEEHIPEIRVHGVRVSVKHCFLTSSRPKGGGTQNGVIHVCTLCTNTVIPCEVLTN